MKPGTKNEPLMFSVPVKNGGQKSIFTFRGNRRFGAIGQPTALNQKQRLLDYLKSSDIFGPRKLFWAKIPLPKKALQKISLDFCLKNQSCYRHKVKMSCAVK